MPERLLRQRRNRPNKQTRQHRKRRYQTAAGTLPSLKDGDAAAIPANVRGVNAISPVVMGSAQLIAGAHNWQTRVQAVRPAYQQIQDWHVSAGAFFTPQDDASANTVVPLGQPVAHNPFPAVRP